MTGSLCRDKFLLPVFVFSLFLFYLCINQVLLDYIVFSKANSSNDSENLVSCASGHKTNNSLELNRNEFVDGKFEKYYNDPVNQRDLIREDNSGKIGVYAWVNKINNKIYVGSGDPLYVRLSDYYQPWYLANRNSLSIVRALNKYTMNNFCLYILEYANSDNVIACEQNWINLLNPEYNLNPLAENSKGYKHTEEAKNKIRNFSLGRKHTKDVRHLMSENRKGENNPFFGKNHSPETIEILKEIASNRDYLAVSALKVEITDLVTKTTTIHDSIRKAATSIDSDIKTLLRREKSQVEKGINTPYRKRYTIKIIRN